jgi:hypothetical protein
MSKQHHFVVFYDTETEEWEVGWAKFEEDEPLYDTETEEWGPIKRADIVRDGNLYDELILRLAK